MRPAAPAIRTTWSRRGAWLLWLGTPIAIFLLALLGVAIAIPGLEVALWWPAAGASVWFALRVPQRYQATAVVIVFAVTTFANTVPGRAVTLAVVYGLANAIEVAIIVLLLSRRGRERFTLRTLSDALRFVILQVSWDLGVAAEVVDMFQLALRWFHRFGKQFNGF